METRLEMIEEIEKVGREIVLTAGEILRKHFGSSSQLTILSKNPSDYVTNADHESESFIISEIKRRFPDHRIIAEESSRGTIQSGTTWIIDPLDGTTNFIHGFPFVAVSVGVYVEDEVKVGFVFDPIHEELFSAVRGKGAWLNDEPLPARIGPRLDEALVSTGFPFRSKAYIEPFMNAFKRIFTNVSGVRRTGSAALDLVYLASGRVDGFWEIGLKPWDLAAGSLIIKEVGGHVSDFWGNGDYLQNGHVVAGVGEVYPFLLGIIREHLTPALESGQV